MSPLVPRLTCYTLKNWEFLLNRCRIDCNLSVWKFPKESASGISRNPTLSQSNTEHRN